MAIINQDGIRSAATPNVYIERVTLANGGAVDSRLDMSVDQSRPVKRTTDRFGDLKFEASPPAALGVTPEQQSLVSILRISLKDLQNTTTNETTWVYNEPSRRNIVYKVIQSTNENLTNYLINSDILDQPNFRIPSDYNETIDYQIKIFSLALQTPEDAIVSTERGTGGNSVLSLEREVQFQMVRQPAHLTYFAFTEFYREGQRGVLNAHSPVAIEKVISSAAIVKDTYGYTNSSGDVWSGPVHYHRSSGWMEGAFHTDSSHGALTRRRYFNSKVCDIRAIDQVRELQVDISPLIPLTEQNSTYTTDLYLTRDQNGNSILLFGFNHLRYMEQNSRFGGLFTRATSELRAQLFQDSSILDLSIVRQKVREARGTSALGSEEVLYVNEREAPEVVVSSYGANNVIQSREKYYIPGAANNRNIEVNSGDPVSDQYKMFGKIQEVAIENAGRFRTFSVTDANIGSLSAGIYKYSIRLRINDGAANYISLKSEELSLAINVLENYLSIAELPRNYNRRTRRYTVDFINRMSNRRSQSASLPWLAAIVKYIEMLDLATNMTQSHKSSLVNCLYSLVSPSTGTNEGVLLLLQLMNELSININSLTGDGRQAHQEGSGPPKSSTSQGSSPRFLTEEIQFQQVFNCNVLNGSGFDYFEVPSPTARQIDPPNGVLVLRREEIRDRVVRETDRYRGNSLSQQELQNIRFLNGSSIEALMSENTLFSYIAPNSVDLFGNSVPLLRDSTDSLDYISATSIIQNVLDNPSSRSFTSRATAAQSLVSYLGSGPSADRLEVLGTIESETSRHQGMGSRPSPPAARAGDGRRPSRSARRQQDRTRGRNSQRSSEEYFGRGDEFTREAASVTEPLSDVLSDTPSPGAATRPSRTSAQPPAGAATTRRTTRNRTRAVSATEGLDTPRRGTISFDLASENNFISTRMLSSAEAVDSVEQIRSLPQQIKSLTLNRNRVYNDSAATVSTESDAETDGFMYNFGMLRRIEYLSGYTANYGKSPIWSVLTEQVVNRMNGAVLCRIRKYTDPNTNIGSFHMLDQLPVYNEFFLLTVNASSIQPRQNAASRNRSQPRRDGGVPSIDSRSIYGGSESETAATLTERAVADASIDGHVEYLVTTPYRAPTNSLRVITGEAGSQRAQQEQRQQRASQQGRQRAAQQRQQAPRAQGGGQQGARPQGGGQGPAPRQQAPSQRQGGRPAAAQSPVGDGTGADAAASPRPDRSRGVY